jgi:site-specific recombinase
MASDSDGVFAGIGRLVRGQRERLALDYLLAQANPAAPLAERVAWLTELLRWIRVHRPPKAPSAAGSQDGEAAADDEGAAAPGDRVLRVRVARVRFLLHLVDRHPEWKAPLAHTLRSVLRDAHGLNLFAATGLPQEYGFWGEAVRRMAAKLLPEARAFDDLAQVFVALFPDRGDEALPAALPHATNVALRALFRFDEAPEESCWAVVQRDLADALVVLVAQVGAIGLSDSIRQRTGLAALSRSPFVALGPAVEAYLESRAGNADETLRDAARRRLAAEIDGCHRALSEATAHLEDNGVSIGLVYRIELAHRELGRIRRLAALAAGEAHAAGDIGRFVAELIRDMHAQRSVRALFASNLDLLARKIAERTGKTGEHYITRDRAEYAHMLQSAGRGGALTGLTVFGKFALTGHGLAPFIEGLVASLNYALSFCAIQFLHGTLATKQPAMTAAAMAAKLKHTRRRGRLREFVDEVANLTRSQVAAIAGNLVVVVPAALIVQLAWVGSGGAPMPNAQKATATIASLNLLGGTPFYAAFTGVLLWLSAVLSGAIENWATYRRLPEAIAREPRLVHAFGAERMQRASAWFASNVAGLGGNVALGFLLGMTPVVAAFFGLPLDVRHVTLSTGALALAVSSLGADVLATAPFWLAVAGIAAIGALNLGVSFTLALWVAIRATRAGALSRRRVFRAVLARLVASPRGFLVPPRTARVQATA